MKRKSSIIEINGIHIKILKGFEECTFSTDNLSTDLLVSIVAREGSLLMMLVDMHV